MPEIGGGLKRRVTLIDVSNVNGSVDFTEVRHAEIAGAFLKVSEGLTFNDPRYSSFRLAAAKAGVRIGGYHFARPDLHPYSPEAEADHFVRALGPVGRRDLRPVLDFETHAPALSGAQLISWARSFNGRVHYRIGLFPLFYTYPSFLPVRPDRPIGGGLWIASYDKNDGKDHPFFVPAPWKKALAHQYTSRGHFPGHQGYVDFSHAPSLRPLLAHPVLGI